MRRAGVLISRTVVPLVIALALVVTGCSAPQTSDAAVQAPRSSSAISPSAEPDAEGTKESPSEAAPAPADDLELPPLPEAATIPDAAGAEAFIGYWYELVNYAYASGDGGVLTPLSHVDCAGCKGLTKNIASATSQGGVWKDLAFAPEQFLTEQPDENGISLSTSLLIRSPDPTVLLPDGSVAEVKGAEVENLKFWAQWTGDHWQAFAIAYPDRVQ